VRDPHRRVGLIDVLAARAARPVGVDLQVVVVDLDRVDRIDDRRYLDPGEAGLTPVRRIERRQAHEAVNTLLARVQPVGVLSLDQEGGRLDPGLLPRRDLEQLHIEPALLRPPHLHPQDHLGPVLRIGAAGAGVDRDERIPGVISAGEQPLLLEFAETLLDGGDLLLQLLRDVRVLFRQLGKRLEVLDVALELVVHREPLVRPSVLGSYLRRPLLVVPEAGLSHLVLERLDALAQRVRVKGSPRAA
jgi:hypothetical protein